MGNVEKDKNKNSPGEGSKTYYIFLTGMACDLGEQGNFRIKHVGDTRRFHSLSGGRASQFKQVVLEQIISPFTGSAPTGKTHENCVVSTPALSIDMKESRVDSSLSE